jgi:hypothetical protein
MPCPGNHEIEFANGPQGFTSYLTRYQLPDNGVPGFRRYWYSFRVGPAVFVSVEADDVVYQDAGPLVSGPAALTPAASTGNPAIPAGTSFYIRGYSHGAQTAWLRRTLAQARADRTVDSTLSLWCGPVPTVPAVTGRRPRILNASSAGSSRHLRGPTALVR